MTEFSDIAEVKKTVLQLTAKHAFAGDLKDTWYRLPKEMIPGSKAVFRCCVYHERAILRQRVKFAMGKKPDRYAEKDSSDTQMIWVIPSACEGCPITKITVTDNCRGCLAKKCMKACPFGAITASNGRAVVDKEKCRECGRCVAACPYNAIVNIQRPCIQSCPCGAIRMDEDALASIDVEKCINCGNCVVGCPFGAITDISMMTQVIEKLHEGEKHIYALVAPSIEGQYPEADLSGIKAALLQLGFCDVIEAAFGADIVSYFEATELAEKAEKGEKLTSSCCPAFVEYIQKHHPELADCISSCVSPMAAAARFILQQDAEAVIVFIGPCFAKKQEAAKKYPDEIPFVLTFEELDAMFHAQNITPSSSKKGELSYEATKFGKGFAVSGGVSASVSQVLRQIAPESAILTVKCAGEAECNRILTLMKAGKLPEDFVEGMFCSGGCAAGPASLAPNREVKKTFEKHIEELEERDVIQSVKQHKADQINPHRPDFKTPSVARQK